MVVPGVLFLQRRLEIAVAPDEDIDRERAAVPAEDFVADRVRVPDADAAAHNEKYVLLLRHGEIAPRRALFYMVRKLFIHGNAGDEDPLRRYALFHKLRAQRLVRDEIAVQLRLREKRDARIVRQHAVARDAEIAQFFDRGHRLHRVEMRAYDAAVAVLLDVGAEIRRVPGVGVIDRRSDAGRAVNVPGAVERVERRGGFLHNGGVCAGHEPLGVFPGENERVKHIVFHAPARQCARDRRRGAVVSLTGVAAQNQYFQRNSLPACFM